MCLTFDVTFFYIKFWDPNIRCVSNYGDGEKKTALQKTVPRASDPLAFCKVFPLKAVKADAPMQVKATRYVSVLLYMRCDKHL